MRVQPGVTWRALNDRLAQDGRRFAPDPASGQVCTIGGMLATNASGAHVLSSGYTRDHVEVLRVVLDSGDVCDLGKVPWPLSPDLPGSHFLDILNALGMLLEQNRDLLAATPAALRSIAAATCCMMCWPGRTAPPGSSWPACWSARRERWGFSRKRL